MRYSQQIANHSQTDCLVLAVAHSWHSSRAFCLQPVGCSTRRRAQTGAITVRSQTPPAPWWWCSGQGYKCSHGRNASRAILTTTECMLSPCFSQGNTRSWSRNRDLRAASSPDVQVIVAETEALNIQLQTGAVDRKRLPSLLQTCSWTPNRVNWGA